MNLFKSFILLFCFTLYSSILHAAQSTIQATVVEAEGYACMGDDKSKKQTEQYALADAKRKASEAALTYVKSETKIQDAALQKDLIAAYSNARIKVIQELNHAWYKDTTAGDCYKVNIRAEVIPVIEELKDSSESKIPAKDILIDSSWHKYQRNIDDWLYAPPKDRKHFFVASDGWRLTVPSGDSKDEYEWGWEISLTVTPSGQKAGHNLYIGLITKIEYFLLDEDGFVLVTDTLDFSSFPDSIRDNDNTLTLLQTSGTSGTTETYRQTSKVSIQKAMRARESKYLIFVK